MKRYPESRTEIRNTLQHVVDGTAGTYELDDCFSVSFSDQKLEAIRQRLWKLPDEFPPETKGKFCGRAGMEVMRGWIKDLSDE
jgi:hypothetical protein